MNTAITHVLAVEHTADLRRTAERQRVIASDPPAGHAATIQLRLGGADEVDVARRLAELDDAVELEAPVLLAFADGQAIAALSLRDRRVVANPFVPTRDAVALLRLRAEHLSDSRARRRFRRRWHLRLA